MRLPWVKGHLGYTYQDDEGNWYYRLDGQLSHTEDNPDIVEGNKDIIADEAIIWYRDENGVLSNIIKPVYIYNADNPNPQPTMELTEDLETPIPDDDDEDEAKSDENAPENSETEIPSGEGPLLPGDEAGDTSPNVDDAPPSKDGQLATDADSDAQEEFLLDELMDFDQKPEEGSAEPKVEISSEESPESGEGGDSVPEIPDDEFLIDEAMDFDKESVDKQVDMTDPDAGKPAQSNDMSGSLDDDEITLDQFYMDLDGQNGEEDIATAGTPDNLDESTSGTGDDVSESKDEPEATPAIKDSEKDISMADAQQPMEAPDTFDSANASLETAMNEVMAANG